MLVCFFCLFLAFFLELETTGRLSFQRVQLYIWTVAEHEVGGYSKSTEALRQRKLKIPNYNLRYPVISYCFLSIHWPIIITVNLQNLRFYQR